MRNRDQTTTPTEVPVEPTSPSTELSDDQLETVSGGGKKKGEAQEEYLIVKMTEVFITG